MSEIDDMRYRVSALERDIATYRDALEEHLYETELNRVERGHGWLLTFFFFGGMFAGTAAVEWLDAGAWYIDIPVLMVTWLSIFAAFFGLTEKPMKREIDRIRKPLTWLPKPSWRENNK